MALLFWYTLKKLAAATLGIVLVLVGVVWLTQSLRFIEIIVNHNISAGDYFSLISCLLPDLLSTILPVCLLLAGLHTYHKLKTDHELQAFYAIGLSPMQTAAPLLCLGLCLTLLVGGLNVYVSPISFQIFREKEHQIRNQFSLSWVRPGVSNRLKKYTIYVREHSAQGELKGVLIHHPRGHKDDGQGPAYTIIAETGLIERDQGSLFLILKKGMRQEFNPNTKKLSVFSFDILKHEIHMEPDSSFSARVRPREKSFSELLNPPESDGDPGLVDKFRVEAHQRILLPWVTMLNALIAAMTTLLGTLERRQGRRRILFASILSFTLHTGLLVCLNLSAKYPAVLHIAYFSVTFLIVFFVFCLKTGFSLKRRKIPL